MNGYTLTLHAYCGMGEPIGWTHSINEDDARQAAARLLRHRRREDFAITVS
jgi:hypothetical protein